MSSQSTSFNDAVDLVLFSCLSSLPLTSIYSGKPEKLHSLTNQQQRFVPCVYLLPNVVSPVARFAFKLIPFQNKWFGLCIVDKIITNTILRVGEDIVNFGHLKDYSWGTFPKRLKRTWNRLRMSCKGKTSGGRSTKLLILIKSPPVERKIIIIIIWRPEHVYCWVGIDGVTEGLQILKCTFAALILFVFIRNVR